MKSYQNFVLSEMPAYNNIKKVDVWTKDTIRGLWEVIQNEVEDIEDYFFKQVQGERIYAFDMRQFWGSSGKAFQFFSLKEGVPVFIASFYYEIELSAWVEDEIGKDGSALDLPTLYKEIINSKGISFTPKRIAGKDHSEGMKKVWKNKLSKIFKVSVVSRKNYKDTGKTVNDPDVWAKQPGDMNDFYVVLEKK